MLLALQAFGGEHFDRVDRNKDGFVQIEEYARQKKRKSKKSSAKVHDEEKVVAEFNAKDRNGDRVLDREEFSSKNKK